MIKEFKENDPRKSAVVFRGTFNAIKKLYQEDPNLAGELAISAIELALTGEISSESTMIGIILSEAEEISKNNKERYEATVESKKQKKIGDQRLDEIANLVMRKFTQKEIASQLGLSQQTVSNRLGLIRRDYPELLQVNSLVQSLQEEDTCTSKNTIVQDLQEETACTSEKVLVQENKACTSNYNCFNF